MPAGRKTDLRHPPKPYSHRAGTAKRAPRRRQISTVILTAARISSIDAEGWKALRNTAAGLPNAENEDPARASRVFAPAGFVPTAAERDLVTEWNQHPAGERLEKSGHH